MSKPFKTFASSDERAWDKRPLPPDIENAMPFETRFQSIIIATRHARSLGKDLSRANLLVSGAVRGEPLTLDSSHVHAPCAFARRDITVRTSRVRFIAEAGTQLRRAICRRRRV